MGYCNPVRYRSGRPSESTKQSNQSGGSKIGMYRQSYSLSEDVRLVGIRPDGAPRRLSTVTLMFRPFDAVAPSKISSSIPDLHIHQINPISSASTYKFITVSGQGQGLMTGRSSCQLWLQIARVFPKDQEAFTWTDCHTL
jgi:hypothetical protein